jgi:hypothetical protein
VSEAGERITIERGWITARWSNTSDLGEVRRQLVEERDRLRETRRAWMAPNIMAGRQDPRADVEELVQEAILTVADAIALACARMLHRLSSPNTASQGEDHEQYAELEPMEVAWSAVLSPVAGGSRLHFFRVPAGFEDQWWRTEPIALCGAAPGVGGIDTRLEICLDCLARRDPEAS